MTVRILTGDCREILKTLPDESVHCVVTSPPYYGLRDYNAAGQIGLEASPQEYIQTLVETFRVVRRVLRFDGSLWLNLGDSYAGSRKGGNKGDGSSTIQGKQPDHSRLAKIQSRRRDDAPVPRNDLAYEGFKAKDLMMMPARVAIALQDDGWYLRQDIIWSKPNPMPESVRDRCTKAHEYVFLLSKSPKYYYDAEAIAEPVSLATISRMSQDVDAQQGSPVPGKTNGNMKAVAKRSGNKQRKASSERGCPAGNGKNQAGSVPWEGITRNKRSVWEISTKPFCEAHFATFPPELAEICIKAGCPRGGVVLDPFGGAGTTGLVADRLQRDAILIELNPEYAEMGKNRIRGDAPMLAEVHG